MIGSIFRVLLGFVLACIAAGAVKVSFVHTPVELLAQSSEDLAMKGLLVLYIATHSAIFAAPFALLAALISEWQGIRGWAFHALAGIAIAIAGFIAQYSSEAPGEPSIVNNYALTAYLAAGFIGGIVYWLVAGRLAGEPEPNLLADAPSPLRASQLPSADQSSNLAERMAARSEAANGERATVPPVGNKA